MTVSTIAGSVFARIGSTSRPEGELVTGHDPRKGKEASPATLANRTSAEVPSHTSRESGRVDTDPTTVDLVRATTRYVIDLRRPKDHADRSRCDALHDELRSVQRDLVRAANVAMRARVSAEAQTLDDYILANGGQPPRSKDWPSARLNDYATIRMVAPTVYSGIASAVAHAVTQKWSADRWDALIRQTKSPPHYRASMPIPLRAQETNVVSDGAGYWLRFGLRAGGRMTLPLSPRDAWQRVELAALASSEWKMGEAKIQEDRLRPRKWYVRVSYKRRVAPSTEIKEAAVNRGIRCFVAAVIGDGEWNDSWIYDGADIEAYLAQVQRRRRGYQRQVRAAARGGHGRRRVLRPIEHLTGKAERWRHTRNQVVAARLANWLALRNVGRVYIEDFTGIRDGEPERLEGGERIWRRVQEWPYYQLELAIRSALEAYGIEVVTVSARYISQTDPRDGSSAVRDLRRWRLRAKDGKSWHLDVGAALNVLSRGRALRSGGTTGNGADSGDGGGESGTARKSNGKATKGEGNGGTGRKA